MHARLRYRSLLAILLLGGCDSGPPVLWYKSVGAPFFDRNEAVAMNEDGSISITGFFNGTTDLGGGPLVSMGDSTAFLASYGPDGAHRWSRQFGGTSFVYGRAVAVDQLGHTVMFGRLSEIADFGGGQRGQEDRGSLILAKYAPDGSHLWSKGFVSEGIAESVAVDGEGNVFITGYLLRTEVDFGGGLLPFIGWQDAFLAKYSSAGIHLWSRRFGSTAPPPYPSGIHGYSVAVDPTGNVVLAGSFQGTADLGGERLESAGNDDIFVAKFSPEGTHLWSHHFGGRWWDAAQSVATDRDGNVLLTGKTQETADLGGGPLPGGTIGDNLFLAKYSASGSHLWSWQIPRQNQVHSQVAADPEGNVVLSGIFWSSTEFYGKLTRTDGSRNGVFVAKYTADGANLWSKLIYQVWHGPPSSCPVAVDGRGQLVAAPSFLYELQVDGNRLTNDTGDIALIKIAP